jgi:hypothetical protein
MVKCDRVYTTKNGKMVLVTWIQRRCVSCGRFLSKFRKKYCKNCYNLKDNKRHRDNREQYRVYERKHNNLFREKRNRQARESYRRRKSLNIMK